MKEENKKENGCKIFCIFFRNNDKNYEFGAVEGKAEIILKNISKLGGTQNYFTSNSLQELSDTFKEINGAIKNNFGLKINKY